MYKTVITLTVALAGLAAMFFVSRKASAPVPPAKFEWLYDVPDFELTDQNGKPVTNRSLLGSVWIADFIFTHCAGPCPVMTSKMAQIQKSITRADVKLVSFTVDPERDTPAVLKEYAKQYDADESRWLFLTGTTEQMFDTARGMKIAAQAATKDQPILHSDLFLLVDRGGRVVGIYHNSDAEDVPRLIRDATELAAR